MTPPAARDNQRLTSIRDEGTIVPMASITRRNLDDPDERRTFELGSGELTRVGPYTIGRGILQPGWRWSTHVGPLTGTASCEVHHVQVLLSGRFGVRMDDGEEVILVPNDLVEIAPGHDAWVIGDEPVVLLDVAGNIEDFALRAEVQRVVTTLLMTDIVDSTKTAARLGDRHWRQTLADHNRLMRVQIARFGGSEIATTGDGFLARFPSAVGALRCAAAVREPLRQFGIEVRSGVHTGEVELTASGVGGISVHAVARIMALAGPGQVFVSAATVGLADGSGLQFTRRGQHEMKGFERPMEIFELEAAGSERREAAG
jgi:class 3 adenylate cyclase